MVRPDLEVTGPAAVTTDLRATPPVEIDLPDPSARLDHASTDTNRWFDGVRYGYGTSMVGEGLRFAQVGQAPPEGALKTLLKHEYEADPPVRRRPRQLRQLAAQVRPRGPAPRRGARRRDRGRRLRPVRRRAR
ncbi:hypothetical protein [Actinosynnema mirum]|uniref:hypothetical protein n=1 Tax=Actinosynnema mirum TaxID=40567 RepID=UPI00117E89E7|nr:hypothetical protein [Actinosynnema mirum]